MSDNVEKKGLFAKMKDSLRAYKSEFKKIVWPSWGTIVKNTGIVLAFILILGVLIYAIDFLFNILLTWVIGLL